MVPAEASSRTSVSFTNARAPATDRNRRLAAVLAFMKLLSQQDAVPTMQREVAVWLQFCTRVDVIAHEGFELPAEYFVS